ncbi:hypothetical protein A3D80_01220 [Candidatus Roizmanbacteria bacterium RIFCSPHIGHO2_02_FULL_40_13b]|uniref:FAD-binding FR-type domain-containing protein n=1 Tax=Candidatus Roizmanbacteria bacterium RIFCSPHIGHO2_01_FULL_39_24 TaxID=1802032 RepID=A0A1F7GHS1_9BACT|nr:MAG: hypothetical protein A2799_02965 [Candidatus Roizmanbacteria bacterium RIFCSPHIGHO2_01_FULL_39_24]OGK26345.1 MAG: hypothetical protein A3D80_01220 [Candidatus Roizmanbacteria bacterium RIFCSPHIGHO2_02_FULL_40_13b]OGK49753.1 MAG: hypothetical protein A3A56_00470 [Candidatus Roizmanbacteria bacterium RIFCSPLOWO2_01_FULL_40_32]OGK57409.1 MAG: hypothetical protein A3H83_04155 [Candidatus Roizmanbacteria bacterium RIFCSPLOWO2_02_FULL_39_8]
MLHVLCFVSMIQDFYPTLSEKEQLAHDIWRFRFTVEKDKKLEFLAGQYMILRIGDVRRLYSVLSSPHDTSYFDLLVQIVPNGIGSTHLMNVSVGDTAFFQGPAGIFMIKDEKTQKIFMATGTGIAPILSMIRTLLSSGHTDPLYLFWGLRAKRDLYFVKEIEKLRDAHENLHPIICLSQEADEEVFRNPIFRKGRINLYVHGFLQKDPAKKGDMTFYVCGAQTVVESLRVFLDGAGIEKYAIHFEKFV